MDLKRFTIAKKMLAGFMTVTIITLIIGIFSYSIAKETLDRMNQVIKNNVAFQKSSQDLMVFALQHRRFEKDFFLNIDNPDKQKGYLKRFKEISKKQRIH